MIPTLRNLPLLAIWGSNDKLVSPEDRMQMRDMINSRMPHAETAEIEGAGHSMRYGFPLAQAAATAVNARIADFLETHLR